jgi:DNA-binding transcriptional ArsR family regulator
MKTLPHPARDDISLCNVFHALSDPVRLSVVRSLACSEAGEQPCGTFDVPVSKATFSHHIRVLREAGVIRIRTKGTQSLTSLRREDLESRFPGLLEAVMQANTPF